jgi:DNA-binding NarL/FixJ family response regulator
VLLHQHIQVGGGIMDYVMSNPIEEFIGQQLHSISNIDAGMMPRKMKGKRSISWWPYQHHKPTKSFNTGSHEDRLIGAIDKARKYPKRSRQDEVEDLLGKGCKKKEVAQMLGVHPNTITADVKKIKLRLVWERSKKSRM